MFPPYTDFAEDDPIAKKKREGKHITPKSSEGEEESK